MLGIAQNLNFSINELFYEFDAVHRKVLGACSKKDVIYQTLQAFQTSSYELFENVQSPCFYMMEEDYSFDLYCNQHSTTFPSIESVIEEQIETGAIGWQLKQNRVGVIELPNHPLYRQMITQSILTPSKTFGLFFGFINKHGPTVSAMSQHFISILNNSIANRLESLDYQKELKNENRSLSMQVEMKTKRLQAINTSLEAENKRRVKVEESLRDTQNELKKACEAKDQFLSLISHELRTPLVPVVTVSELLKENLQGDENIVLCDLINTSGQHLLRMVEDLLEISSANPIQEEKNTATHPLMDVQIVPFVTECLSFLKEQAVRKGLEFSVINLLPENLRILVPISHLRQIIVHLVGNAVKFTDHGKVVIQLEKDLDQRTVIRIQDTGIGIEQHHLDRIFEPFSQVDSSHSRRHSGAGLGLSICKNLAKQSNFDLEISSVFTRGTTVKVCL